MPPAGEVLQRNSRENVDPCSGPHRGSPQLHVLAVDDSHVDRKVIERLLRSLSCEVTTVESGSRALQFLGLDGERSSDEFDALKVNLIMTDYSMPGMTGYELLKKIKRSSAFKEIPVVIMSSERIRARIGRCLEEGAEEFLAKPVKLSDVERLTGSLTRGDAEVSKLGKRRLQTDDSKSSPVSPLLSRSPSPSELSSPMPRRLKSGQERSLDPASAVHRKMK